MLQDFLNCLERLVWLETNIRSIKTIVLDFDFGAVFLSTYIKASWLLIIFGLILFEINLHKLFPNPKGINELVQIVPLLHLIDQYFADSEDEAQMALIYHMHAVQENKLPIPEMHYQTSQKAPLVVLSILQVSLFEIAVILRKKMLHNFKDNVMYDIIPAIFLEKGLNNEGVTCTTIKKSKV